MAGVEAPRCDPLSANWCSSGADRNLPYPLCDADGFSKVTARHARWRYEYSRIVPIAFVLLIACYPFGDAVAQTCSVSGSSVTLASGSCAIAPNTTLNGSPGVHTTTGAQVTTNNVTINPFNGGSTGGLADTNGIVTFSSGSIIEGNFATAASAQTGGQIIFQPGSVINPATGGGEIALLANGVGSQITATGLSVHVNGNGGDVAAKATGGGSIFLNQGTTISFPAGGGGRTFSNWTR
jgi:hypothetical protein